MSEIVENNFDILHPSDLDGGLRNDDVITAKPIRK